MKRSEFMLGGEDVKEIKACQAMESSVRYCSPSTSWRDIASALVDGGYGSLPVVDSKKKLVGIVSEFDLLKVITEGRDEKKITAKNIMTKKPVTVKEDAPMLDVIKLLEDKHLIRVPVVRNSKLVGILARRDLLLCHLRATGKPQRLF